MNGQPITEMRRQGGNGPVLVVTPDNGRFRVYDASDPNHVFDVEGTPNAPSCSCPEFQANGYAHGFRCQHVNAVFPRTKSGESHAGDTNGGFQMSVDQPPHQLTLKRSISPDGRIDSLSVEFSICVDGLTPHESHKSALRGLALQNEIIASFLNQQSSQVHENSGGNGAVPVTLRDIGGMQTRWGWRNFINVEANGNVYKLFGNRKQLGEHLVNAGHAQLGDQISTGKALNVSCLAMLENSEDGKYTNVVQLLPVTRQQAQGES